MYLSAGFLKKSCVDIFNENVGKCSPSYGERYLILFYISRIVPKIGGSTTRFLTLLLWEEIKLLTSEGRWCHFVRFVDLPTGQRGLHGTTLGVSENSQEEREFVECQLGFCSISTER